MAIAEMLDFETSVKTPKHALVTRVFKYGAGEPTEHLYEVLAQLRLAQDYRCNLTTIEGGCRAALRSVLGISAEVVDLEKALREAEEVARVAVLAVNAMRSSTKSRSETEEASERVRAARAAAKEVRTALAQARERQKVDLTEYLEGASTGDDALDAYVAAVRAYQALGSPRPSRKGRKGKGKGKKQDEKPVVVRPLIAGPNSKIRHNARDAREAAAAALRFDGEGSHPVARAAALDVIRLRAGALQRSARAYCGIPQGTYSLVEDAAKQAALSTPMYRGAEPVNPKYPHFRGGSISIQIDGGMTVEELFGGDPRVSIDPVDVAALTARTGGADPGERKGWRMHARTTMRMRIGTTDAGEDIRTALSLLLHRPLPARGIIKRITISCRVEGPRRRWSVEITIQAPADQWSHCEPAEDPEGVVAIDLGWRGMGSALAVARECDAHGSSNILSIEEPLMERFVKACDVISVRDKRFKAAQGNLLSWLAANDAPDWLREQTKTLAAWKSPGRLAKLVERWSEQRFDGDATIMGARASRDEVRRDVIGPGLLGWKQKNDHLWTWLSDQGARVIRQRNAKYAEYAARIASRYGTVIVPSTDYSEVQQGKPVGEDKPRNDVAEWHRHVAAVGKLRECIADAVKKRGGKLIKVEAAPVCPACGTIEPSQIDRVEHTFTCTSCTYTADEDVARVLTMLHAADMSEHVKKILAKQRTILTSLKSGEAADVKAGTGRED